jgi:hypothetical protein
MANVKMNLRATGYPQSTDDSSTGYAQGSYYWFNGVLFLCRSATPGAAVWTLIGDEEAFPSGTLCYPDNFGGTLSNVTPGTSNDVYALFPFLLRRPVSSVGMCVPTLGASGAAVTFGLYTHDRTTQKAGTRIANIGTIDLTTSSTGLRIAGFTAQDLVGLFWVSVHMKLIGTTAPTVVQMGTSNGRHIHSGGGSDLVALAPFKCYSSSDTYTSSPPTTPFVTQPGTAAVACPVLKAA